MDDVIETVGSFSVPEFVAVVLAAVAVSLVVETLGPFSASELVAAALVVESVAILQ